MLRIIVAVLLSGAASLVYQVSWTRRLADITSATAYAQAIVLAVFFCGLGLGAKLPGRVAARARRPLVGYAIAEIGALTSAIVSIPLLDLLDRARAALARAGASPTLALAGELTLAGLFLLIPTTFLGASLPFVLEHVERVEGASRMRSRGFVGLLYGANTLGAAVGCALAAFVLIERAGLARATALGAGLSFAAALTALSVRARPAGSPVESRAPPSAAPLEPGLLGAAAAAGLVGAGAEIVWTRLFSLVVLNTVYAFAQVLIAVLFGIAVGAWSARRLAGRSGAPGASLRSAAFAQLGAALTMAAVPPCSLLLAGRTQLEAAIAQGRSLAGALGLALVIVPPVALNAAALPLLIDSMKSQGAARAFGGIYAANTAGGVLGSLAAGFLLVPRLGVGGASAVLEVISLIVAFTLLRRALIAADGKKSEAAAIFVPGVVIVALHLFFPDVPRQIYSARLPPDTRLLELREGVLSDVAVTESEQGQRRIWINSSWVAGTGGGHRALGHLPALFNAAPRRALGIALGTGQTFAAVFANGVTEIHVVEINPDVIRLSRRWFAEANNGLFDKPGVIVHENDGRAFLRSHEGSFDLIVLEPLQAWSAGTSALYSRQFYEEARRVLAPGGVVAQWIPLYGQGVSETRSMVRTAASVFPDASLWLDDHDGILLLGEGPLATSPAEIDARIAARGVGPDLRRRSISGAADVFSLLVLGPEGVDRWTRGADIITDDRPFLEFAAGRTLGEDAFEAIVQSALDARLEGTTDVASMAGGASDVTRLADSAGRALLAASIALPGDFDARAAALERGLEGAPASELLRRRYRSAIDGWAAGIAAGPPGPALEAVLRRGVEHDPDFGEAMLNLAVLAARRGDIASARKLAERASHIDRVRAPALQMLSALPEGSPP